MNIDYPVWIALYEFRAENGHKARQDYNVYRILLEQLFYAPFKNLLASALLFRYRYGVNAGIMCPYKRICVLLAGYYQLDLAAFKFAFIAGVNESLKICSPSGYQHGYIGLFLAMVIFIHFLHTLV